MSFPLAHSRLFRRLHRRAVWVIRRRSCLIYRNHDTSTQDLDPSLAITRRHLTELTYKWRCVAYDYTLAPGK